jgi:hypothetical protein
MSSVETVSGRFGTEKLIATGISLSLVSIYLSLSLEFLFCGGVQCIY